MFLKVKSSKFNWKKPAQVKVVAMEQIELVF